MIRLICFSPMLVLLLMMGGCSSEPVVIEATPEQQEIYKAEYEKEMQRQ
ncbi:hypothetical protein LF1_25440 [Rubripirellula obstinata]|uniref:Secreted protein n=1 Tax=Rubripirellula obstinata TaxID=406547 RepID=A0A5B1CHI6_9BACT|nr:hypothetical protein LF1_25440 [Rubripirellula obstinata]